MNKITSAGVDSCNVTEGRGGPGGSLRLEGPPGLLKFTNYHLGKGEIALLCEPQCGAGFRVGRVRRAETQVMNVARPHPMRME